MLRRASGGMPLRIWFGERCCVAGRAVELEAVAAWYEGGGSSGADITRDDEPTDRNVRL